MTKSQIRTLVVLIIIFTGQFYPVKAQTNVKDEIISRCRAEMNEYGSAMVKACVDMDIEALVALNKVPKKYEFIISRCLKEMKEYGYAMVKACVDMDVEAEEALEKY